MIESVTSVKRLRASASEQVTAGVSASAGQKALPSASVPSVFSGPTVVRMAVWICALQASLACW